MADDKLDKLKPEKLGCAPTKETARVRYEQFQEDQTKDPSAPVENSVENKIIINPPRKFSITDRCNII